MSFILDALKKAESERSRQSGPVLMDVRVVAPRQRLPVWAWILGGVLLANLLVLAWLLLRTPRQPSPVAAATQQQAAATPPAAPAPPPVAVVEPVAPAPAIVVPTPAAPAPTVLPAQSPAPVPSSPVLPRIDNLPTAQDLVAQGVSLPTLTLNLHVYDEVPANRYVLLNAMRLREGDEVAEGIRVETIVPGGVVFNARGRRFVVLAGG
jgi:general secretion pathway protein B